MASAPNASVEISDALPLEVALHRLKKTLLVLGVYREMRDRAFYRSPKTRRKAKSKKARARRAKAERKRAAFELHDGS